MGGTAKNKGDLLEDLVASLHQFPQATVQTRVRLLSIKKNSKRKREIDVLLTTQVHGYPVRLAFSCKNERKKVREGQVSQFLGDLADVGIPPQCGIVVTPTGFTKDALELALENELRPLLFEGLNDKGLAAVVSQALRAFVCFVCEWRDYHYFDAGLVPAPGPLRTPNSCNLETELVVRIEDGEMRALLPHILTRLWELWQGNKIPLQFGEHSLFLRVKSTTDTPIAHVIFEFQVFALVASVEGEATNVRLRHAKTKQLEKQLVTAKVPLPKQAMPMLRMDTEQELEQLVGGRDVRVVHRIRVPRLVSGPSYWPPTIGALNKLRELIDAGKLPTFEAVEGLSIAKAWEFTVRGRSGGGASETADDSSQPST